jgi:hypothetical protein
MQNQKQIPNSQEELAREIAGSMGEKHRVELYQRKFRNYDESVIRRAFGEATKVPADRIKKSKSALFLYLLNKYAEK